jgi:ribosomal-protein-alanine N-acetyltransferase
MIEVQISSALETDVPEIIRLANELRLESWSPADYLAEVTGTKGIVLIAKTIEEITVGFIVGRRVPGAGPASCEAEIYNLGVSSTYGKKGIGRKLMEAFVSACGNGNLAALWLEVRASNKDAIRFYKRQGFIEIAFRNNFYKAPAEHAVVMRRTGEIPPGEGEIGA